MNHNFLFCALGALMMSVAPLHATGEYIDITFGARGEVTTVSSVTVENLTQGTTVSLDGSDILRLGEAAMAIENISTAITHPIIYPNPAYGDGTLAFDTKGGEVAVQIYGTNGLLIAARSFDDVAAGRHAINLPALAAGQYVVRFQANGSEQALSWMCVGEGSNGCIGLDNVNADAVTLPFKKMAAAAPNTPKVVPMEYTVGDLLRFTGENGNRRTIVMNQPTCDHDIIFDLYECKDANGYNYTCVRAGDLLWMAEDLRPLNNITGLTVTSDSAIWVDAKENTPMEFLINGDAYYNLAAIDKVVPSGWHVPSAGEFDYLINKLGNCRTAGNLLKSRDFNWARPVNGLDSVSFGGLPNGYIDRNATLQSKNQKGCWITSSTMNHGKVVSTEISLYNDSVYSPISHSHNRYAYALRACRHVPSPYQQMMEYFNVAAYEAPARQQAPARVAPPFRYVSDGPLGSHYEQASTRTSLWYNYSGRQFGSTNAENRSGTLFKEANSNTWKHDKKGAIPFPSSNPQSVLRKMAAQTRANGYQTNLYAEWSRPFRLLVDDNGTAAIETPQVCGSGTIAIREMGDLKSGFSVGNPRNLLDANGTNHQFTLPSYNQNNKLKTYYYNDSKRLSEVPEAYTIASFNIKCIRDLTGDGIDEIVTSVGEEICVFDGATYRLMYSKNFRGTGASSYLGFCQIRIEVADVDNDGWEDILALVADGASYCHLNIYRSGRIDQAPMFSNDGINGPIIPTYGFLNDIKVGHVCGQAYPDICLQTRGIEVISGNETTAWNSFLYIYRLQPIDNGNSTSYNLQTVVNGSEIQGYRNNQHDNAFDGVIGNVNLCIAYLRGQHQNPDLIVADGLWRCDPDRSVPTYRFQILPAMKNSNHSIFPDNLVACDPKGDGREKLLYFNTWNTYDNIPGTFFTARFRQGGMYEAWLDNDNANTPSKHANLTHDLAAYGNSGDVWSDNPGWETIFEFSIRNGGSSFVYDEVHSNCAMAAVRDRERARRYEYVGYERTYSEPRIYALLAAAPYYEDYNNPGTTTWGKAFSESDATCKTNEYHASLITGFNREVNVPIFATKIGEVDLTAKFNMDFNDSRTTVETVAYGESHSADKDDRVIMQVSPFDTYTYRIIASDNPDDLGGEVQLSSPLPRMFLGLKLADYNRMTADQKNVPNLSHYFSHTPGKPFSYPDDEAFITSQAENPHFMWGRDANNNTAVVSCGTGGFTTRTISMQKDTTKANSETYGFELELVTIWGVGVKAGAGFGYDHTNETSHTVSETHEVSAQVSGVESANDPEHPLFRWNFVWYKECLEGQEFPVITYMVKK